MFDLLTTPLKIYSTVKATLFTNMSVVTTCHRNIKRKTSSLGFSLSVKMKSKRSLLNLSLHLGKPTNIKSVKIIISREEYKLCITLILADFTN